MTNKNKKDILYKIEYVNTKQTCVILDYQRSEFGPV
jgi:hypothetical protein